MMDRTQLIKLISDVLRELGKYSESAVNLLLGTAAQESALGEFWYQKGGGPARGIFQMEPATELDTWKNFINKNGKVKLALLELGYSYGPNSTRLLFDLRYQIIMARLDYARAKEALPGSDDVAGMARYWKKYYNTPLGKGTEAEFIENWKRYVA